MRLLFQIFFIFSFSFSTINLAKSAESIELIITIDANSIPNRVTLNREDTMQSIDLQLDHQAGNVFKASIPHPLNDSDELKSPHVLVASWGDIKELLYLNITLYCPTTLKINLHHSEFKCDYNAIDSIEALDSDLDSVLKRYIQARYFHKQWRGVKHQPFHAIALRSARLWYDAAAKLVLLSNNILRMDKDIEGIMAKYEERSKNDKKFGERYRKYARQGYIKGISSQLVAHQYAFVGEIPELVANGNYQKAFLLNSAALVAFNEETSENKTIINERMGVDTHLLENNSHFINSFEASF